MDWDPEVRGQLQLALEYLGEADSRFRRLATLEDEELLNELGPMHARDLRGVVLNCVLVERRRVKDAQAVSL